MDKVKTQCLESLFPKIDDIRKYERLVNAQIRPTIITQNVDAIIRDEIKNRELGFTDEDYYTAYLNKCYTPDSFLEHYREERSTFKLSNEVQWNDQLLDKVADYIEKNPTCLPYFLQFNALTVLGGLFGNSSLFSDVYNRLTADEKYTWSPSYISTDDYAWMNFLAKYRLSVLLAVIDRLLDKGINLAKYRFTYLDRETTLGDIFDGTLWYEHIVKYIPEEGYNRSDVFSISKETLERLISFEDLDGFLNFISAFVEMDHYRVYNDKTMLDPKKIVPFTMKKRYFDITASSVIDYLYDDAYPKDCTVDITDCCARYRQKLDYVSRMTKCELLNRRLEELRSNIVASKDDDNFDWSTLNRKFQSIYDEIKTLPKNAQTNLLDAIEELARLGQVNIQTEKPTALEMRVANLEEAVATNITRLDTLERRVSNLEEALVSVYDYIDSGTPIPQNVAEYLSKRNAINIMAHPTKNKNATLRKAIVLGALILGSLPLLISSSSSIIPNEETKLSFSQNPVLIEPTRPSKQPIIDEPTASIEPTPTETPVPKTVSLYEPIKEEPTKYYRSIYDKMPAGTTSQGGITIRYYLLQDGICVVKLETEKELAEFLKYQGENIYAFTWKAAICSLSSEKVAEYISSGLPVPAEYTTYFADYTPSLDIDFDYKNPSF